MGGEEGWAPLCIIERWRAERVCVCMPVHVCVEGCVVTKKGG